MDNNQNTISSNELVNSTTNDVLFQQVIENIINNYVDNNQQTPPSHSEQSIPRQSNNHQYVENMSMIHALRDVFMGYNTNMREYQENIRNFLNIIQTTQSNTNNTNNIYENTQNQYIPHPPQQTTQTPQNQPQTPPQQNRTGRTNMYNIRQPNTNRPFSMPSNNRTSFTIRPIQTVPRNPMNNRPISSQNQQDDNVESRGREFTQLPNIISNIFNTDAASLLLSDRNIGTRIGRGLFNTFRDVVVYPSREQIINATRNIEFSDSSANMNTSCPITLDEFQNGDVVRQIIPCGHIFQETALRNWFSRNVRCPVCRYDIRDYIPNNREQYNNDVSNNSTNATGINYNTDSDSDIDTENNDVYDETTRHSFEQTPRTNPPNTSTSQRTNTAANNVNRIVNNIINSTSRTLDEMLSSYMSNYTDISDNSIYRVEIPLYYDEYYDASDNYLGMGDLSPDYE